MPAFKTLSRELMLVSRFGVVGAAGFLVDAAVLLLVLRVANLNPYAARVVSASIAILFTFAFNRQWSFAAARKHSIVNSFLSYVSTQGVGLVCNFAIYSAIIAVSPHPLIALAAASAIAMAINYLGARFIAFRN